MANLEQNKAASRRALAELDKGNFNVMDEVCAPGAAFRFPGTPQLDVKAFKDFCRMFYAAFPDLKHEIRNILAEGDQVARTGVFSGTHKGEFQGLPATGRRVEVSFASIDRFDKAGKLVELNGLFDVMGMMQQLGAVPAPAAA